MEKYTKKYLMCISLFYTLYGTISHKNTTPIHFNHKTIPEKKLNSHTIGSYVFFQIILKKCRSPLRSEIMLKYDIFNTKT